MSSGFERPRDVVGGLLVVGIGGLFLLFGRELPVGSSFRMGPGYFPAILSWLMVALGAVMAGLAWRAPHQEGAFGAVPWRALVLIVGATLFFGLALRGLGLLPVLVVVVFATAWASRYASLKASTALALGIALFCSGLFIKGLGLPLPLTGPWLSTTYWSPPAPPPPRADQPPPPPPRRSKEARAMELLDHLGLGFATALQPWNLLYAFVGCLLGTAVGVLPGLGPLATIAMLLPLTFSLPPVSALIMLSGIYYGAQYGGSTTAILINLPGESSSVVTAIDGYQMAKNGRAGQALATAAMGSFFAGSVATVILALFAPPLANVALEFGPAEYFSLMVLGLVASVALASGSLLKAFTMIVLGLLLGLVGTDVETGTPRFTFDLPELADGLNFVALAMGVFGLGEIIRNLEHEHTRSVMVKSVSGLWLTKDDFKRVIGPVLRGTGLGSVLGILPGGGAMLASFAAYTLEKRLSPNKAQFGKGAIEGVAAPEAANNAGAQTSFIPMLTLGIPSNPVMALMIGALIIQGITPGPNVVTDEPALFWGLIVSMWVGNLMLVLLEPASDRDVGEDADHPLPPAVPGDHRLLLHRRLQREQQRVRRLRHGHVRPGRLGADQARLRAGTLAAGLRARADARGEPAPGDDHLPRQPTVFVTHPLSLGLLIVSAALLMVVLLPNIRAKREEAFQE